MTDFWIFRYLLHILFCVIFLMFCVFSKNNFKFIEISNLLRLFYYFTILRLRLRLKSYGPMKWHRFFPKNHQNTLICYAVPSVCYRPQGIFGGYFWRVFFWRVIFYTPFSFINGQKMTNIENSSKNGQKCPE